MSVQLEINSRRVDAVAGPWVERGAALAQQPADRALPDRLAELACEPGFGRINLAVSINAPNDVPSFAGITLVARTSR